MNERKDWSESANNFLKVIVILLFFLGTVIFGKKVGDIEFKESWRYWAVLVLGEISYLYSFVFAVAGIGTIVAYFKNKEDVDWGFKCGLMCLCIATVFQCVFWGIALADGGAIRLAVFFTVASVLAGWWLRRSSIRK